MTTPGTGDDARRRLGKAAMVPLWSSGFIAGTLATRAHDPALTMTFWRFVFAAPLMGLIAVLSGTRWPRERRVIVPVVVVGVLLQAVQFTGIYLSLQYGVPAGLAALLAGSSPILVALAATVSLNERLRGSQWLGSAIGVAGVVVAVAEQLHGSTTIKGLLFALLGLAGLVGGTLVQLAVGAAVMGAITAASQGFSLPITERALAPVAYLVAGPSIVAVLLFFWLLKREKGGEATSFLYLVPSVTALAAVPILGQSLQAGVVVGLVLALVGTAMVNTRRVPEPVRRARRTALTAIRHG